MKLSEIFLEKEYLGKYIYIDKHIYSKDSLRSLLKFNNIYDIYFINTYNSYNKPLNYYINYIQLEGKIIRFYYSKNKNIEITSYDECFKNVQENREKLLNKILK